MTDTNDKQNQTPAAPADKAAGAPAAGRRFGGFKRGTGTGADAPAAGSEQAQGGGDSAAPEAASTADGLVDIDFDKALAHSSTGLHRGTIKGAKVFNAKGTAEAAGITVSVQHEDGARASCLFSLKNAIKDQGKPRVDEKTGRPVMEPNVRGQKAWAAFAAAFDLTAKDLTRAIVDFTEKRTNEAPPIVGVEAMWQYKDSSGGFLNCEYDADATATMRATDEAAAA